MIRIKILRSTLLFYIVFFCLKLKACFWYIFTKNRLSIAFKIYKWNISILLSMDDNLSDAILNLKDN